MTLTCTELHNQIRLIEAQIEDKYIVYVQVLRHRDHEVYHLRDRYFPQLRALTVGITSKTTVDASGQPQPLPEAVVAEMITYRATTLTVLETKTYSAHRRYQPQLDALESDIASLKVQRFQLLRFCTKSTYCQS